MNSRNKTNWKKNNKNNIEKENDSNTFHYIWTMFIVNGLKYINDKRGFLTKLKIKYDWYKFSLINLMC